MKLGFVFIENINTKFCLAKKLRSSFLVYGYGGERFIEISLLDMSNVEL